MAAPRERRRSSYGAVVTMGDGEVVGLSPDGEQRARNDAEKAMKVVLWW